MHLYGTQLSNVNVPFLFNETPAQGACLSQSLLHVCHEFINESNFNEGKENDFFYFAVRPMFKKEHGNAPSKS
jgi:hypothetical protein